MIPFPGSQSVAERMSLELGVRVPVSVTDRQAMLDFAVESVRAAGAVILPYFRGALEVENKLQGVEFDPVTKADKAAEAVIRERISARYPAHGVFGEEFGWVQGNGLTWVIDPIDGTKSFMSGMLHWGVLIALFDGVEPVLGVMHQPFTGEIWVGTGDAAWYEHMGRRVPLRSRQDVTLEDAVLATTSPRFLKDDGERSRFLELERRVRLSRYGGDCYLYATLAMGLVDLGVDGTLSAYDIQPLVPIIRGAGGVVTLWDGGDPSFGGTVLAAGNPLLHRQALEILGRS